MATDARAGTVLDETEGALLSQIEVHSIDSFWLLDPPAPAPKIAVQPLNSTIR